MKAKRNPSVSSPRSRSRKRPSLSHHARKCQVCRHPQRERIETYYLDWYPAVGMTKVFDVDDDAILRHAAATGLEELRARNVRTALAHFIEQSSVLKATPHAIVRAVEAYTHIDSRGRWIESPTSHLVLMPGQSRKPQQVEPAESLSPLAPGNTPETIEIPPQLTPNTGETTGETPGSNRGMEN